MDLSSRRELTYKSTQFPAGRSTPYACLWDVKVFVCVQYSIYTMKRRRGERERNTIIKQPIKRATTGEQKLPLRTSHHEIGRAESTGRRAALL